MQMQELAQIVRNIPPVTRFFTVCSVLACGLVGLGMLNPGDLTCNLSDFYYQWQLVIIAYRRYIGKAVLGTVKFRGGASTGSLATVLWAIAGFLGQSYRCFTAFLLPSGVLQRNAMSAIIDMYFFYNFANHVELNSGKFKGNFPDCLWFTLVLGTVIGLLTFVVQWFDPTYFALHHEMMLLCITYIWLRWLKNSIINFFGVVPIKAYYLPLFNLFFKMLLGRNAVFNTLTGIWGGYLYLCFALGTMPFYNLLSTSYGQSPSPERRVGSLVASLSSPHYVISDSVYDKGNLPGPVWLYNYLRWPLSRRVRQTLFTTAPINHASVAKQRAEAARRALGTSLSPSLGAFRGKGHRLGG